MQHLPKAILFDLDETLITFGRRREQIDVVAEEFGLPAGIGSGITQSFDRFWGDAARHKHWRFRLAEARAESARIAFAELGLPAELAVPFAERFHAYREAQMDEFPQALQTIDILKAAGVRLSLVTNGDATQQRAKVDRFALAPRFDHIQIEGEVGFGKPEERAYRHALDALGVAAAEAWMVGDNLDWEVAGPQRLGIYAIWHDHLGEGLPPGSPVKPDRIIRAIPELLTPPD